MATYRVVLTVKDSSGQVKEINGGTLDVDLQTLTADELDQLKLALEAANFVTQNKLEEELDDYATDALVLRCGTSDSVVGQPDSLTGPSSAFS